MEGQVFVTSAVAFSALIILAAMPAGPLASSPDGFRDFFKASLEGTGESFNDALGRNATPRAVEREIFSYYWFIERLTQDRSLAYGAYSVLIFPEKGELRAINYRNVETEISIWTGDTWTNTTLEPKESFVLQFSPGTSSFAVYTDESERSLNAATPRIVHWMRMGSGSQNWQNSRVG